jgi:hypothetical protein
VMLEAALAFVRHPSSAIVGHRPPRRCHARIHAPSQW